MTNCQTDDQLAKELFGRKFKTIINTGRCLSCNKKVLRRQMTKDEVSNWKEYGLCPECDATTM